MSRHNHILHFHISKKKRITFFDKFIVIAAFVYPLSGVPQVMQVAQGNADGVSAWSWGGFMIFSGLFLAYGIVHKIKPMVITNALWLTIDALIVLGLVSHHIATLA
jgi:hypothetical protein